jgi:DNA-binding MarR family transcriptional regulator
LARRASKQVGETKLERSARSRAVSDDEAFALYAAVRMVHRGMKVTKAEIRLSAPLRSLSESDMEAILVIGEEGSCTAGHLAQTLAVVPTTGTTIVDRLVSRRLVSRRRSDRDRRSVWLSLTTAGLRALDAIRAIEMSRCRSFLAALEPPRRRQVTALLRLVGARFRAEES